MCETASHSSEEPIDLEVKAEVLVLFLALANLTKPQDFPPFRDIEVTYGLLELCRKYDAEEIRGQALTMLSTAARKDL